MGNIFYDATQDLLNCGLDNAQSARMHTVVADLQVFAFTEAASYINITWNWFSIYSNVNGAVSDWENADYSNFGQEMGSIFKLVNQ